MEFKSNGNIKTDMSGVFLIRLTNNSNLSNPEFKKPLLHNPPYHYNYTINLRKRPAKRNNMPSSRQAIHAPGAPQPNGDYSHAVKSSNGTLYLAGWMGDDPETGEIVEGGIEAQTVCSRS